MIFCTDYFQMVLKSILPKGLMSDESWSVILINSGPTGKSYVDPERRSIDIIDKSYFEPERRSIDIIDKSYFEPECRLID